MGGRADLPVRRTSFVGRDFRIPGIETPNRFGDALAAQARKMGSFSGGRFQKTMFSLGNCNFKMGSFGNFYFLPVESRNRGVRRHRRHSVARRINFLF